MRAKFEIIYYNHPNIFLFYNFGIPIVLGDTKFLDIIVNTPVSNSSVTLKFDSFEEMLANHPRLVEDARFMQELIIEGVV